MSGVRLDRISKIYVTHDQTEAMTLGHRVAVMRKGVLQQVDAPQVLYDRPVNLFVAGYIGSPAMKLLEGTLERHDDPWDLVIGSHRLAVDPGLLAARPALEGYDRRSIGVGIRPEDISDDEMAPGPPDRIIEGRAESAVDAIVEFADWVRGRASRRDGCEPVTDEVR